MNCKHSRAAAAALTIAMGAAGAGVTLPAAADHTYGPFSVGADARLREVYIGNIGLTEQTLTAKGAPTGIQNPTANRVFQRYRLRGWGQYAPSEHFALATRLIWEGRHYTLPPTSALPRDMGSRSGTAAASCSIRSPWTSRRSPTPGSRSRSAART